MIDELWPITPKPPLWEEGLVDYRIVFDSFEFITEMCIIPKRLYTKTGCWEGKNPNTPINMTVFQFATLGFSL